MQRRALFAAILVLSSCDPAEPIVDGGSDAGRATCADPTLRWAFPSARWIGAEGLVVPEGDLVGDAVRAEGWVQEVEALDAWPRRPLLLVPLDRAASDVDATRARIAMREGDALTLLDRPVDVRVVGDDTLLVQPRDPLPPGAAEVVFALDAGVAGDAIPLAVCGDEAAQGAAIAAWPDAAPAWAQALAIADSSAPMVALWERLSASPALTVTSSETVSLASLGEVVPSADATHYRGDVVRGQLALPEYRADGEPFALDADGAPMARGTTAPAFVIALPSTGTAPYPTVLFQHGGGGLPEHLFRTTGQLAAAGFAVVAIDLPEHGLRAPAGGPGGDLAFLDFESPQATRENFRQAIADHLAVLTGIAALNDAIETELALADALDPTRLFYLGISLGAVSGSMTVATARGLEGAALFVGGGGYPELIDHGVFAIAGARLLRGAEPRPRAMLALLETIGDGADPLAFALAAEDQTARPTPMLFFQAIDDPLIAHVASDQWARAFGASLARPVHHEAVGLPLVDLPTSDNFRFTSSGEAATRLLTHNPMTEHSVGERHAVLIETDYGQAMVARCFTTILAGGTCEVVDTGFAGR